MTKWTRNYNKKANRKEKKNTKISDWIEQRNYGCKCPNEKWHCLTPFYNGRTFSSSQSKRQKRKWMDKTNHRRPCMRC